jgi:NADPH-dependent 2,4-dienoyl-CoA reductase/sulfur reductase-like enzyme
MIGKLEAKYLIIGNSAGGIGAAEAIRQVDRSGSITIVSDETYPAYSRPLTVGEKGSMLYLP